MELQTIIAEINLLPLRKKFFVIEQTLKAIKKEEFKGQPENDDDLLLVRVNEKSLAQDWLSEEDNRWDNIL
jgi:hypothetical protein